MGYETDRKVILDMPMATYHRTQGLSSSALGYADESMAKYRCYLDGGIKFESKAMDLGTAVHALIENEDAFHAKYVVKPEGIDYRTKEGKAWKESIDRDQIIIDSETATTVFNIGYGYKASDDDLIQMVINSEGHNESSIFWNEHGMINKCRPDRLIYPNESDCEMLCSRFPDLFEVPFGISICVDYKTTSKAIDPKSWYWTCVNFKYFLKAAHYAVGTSCDAFMFVVLETVPPYGVGRYFISKRRMNEWIDRRSELLMKIAECEANNTWPGLSISDEETML